MKDENLQKLIPLIYEASTDIEAWTDIAGKLSDVFGAAGIGVVDQPLTPSGQLFYGAARFEQAMTDKHFEEFSTPDTNLGLALVMNAPLDVPFNLLSYVDQKTFDDHPSVRALLRPQGFDKALIVTMERNEDLLSFTTVLRRTGQPDFDETDLRKLGDLSRHIKKSHKFRRFLYARDQERIAVKRRAAQSHIVHGLITLNLKGKVLDTDAGAEAILREPNGLKLRNGRLIVNTGNSSLDGDDLQAFVQTPAQHAGPLIIRGRNEVFIVLEHFPVTVSDAYTPERLCRFITMKRIRTSIAPETMIFSKAYKLTKAEARVVDALSYSDNASEAARALGITRDTIKSHLNKIYGKTGVNSLPQLMLLMGRLS